MSPTKSISDQEMEPILVKDQSYNPTTQTIPCKLSATKNESLHLPPLQKNTDEISLETSLLSTPKLIRFIMGMQFKKKESENYIKAISYEVSAFNLNEQKITKRFRKSIKGGDKSLTVPFTYYLEKKLTKNSIKIHIYALSSKDSFLGTGSYKKVKKSLSLYIDLEKWVVSDVSETVIQRLITKKGSDHLKMLTLGIEAQQTLLKKFPSAIKIVSISRVRRYISKNSREKYEIEQEWFNGDLEKVIRFNQLPLKMIGDSEVKTLSQLDKLDILCDAAATLHKMHETYMVHRDVKPANILVRIHSDRTSEGYLSDFDFTQPAGIGRKGEYYYWDNCSRFGFILPSTDVYGLILTTAEIFLPKFISFTKLDPLFRFNNLFRVKCLKRSVELKISSTISSYELGGEKDSKSTARKLLMIIFNSSIHRTYDDLYQYYEESIQELCIQSTSFKITLMQNLIKDLKVMHMVIQLIYEAFIRSMRLKRHIKDNKDTAEKLSSEDPTQRQEAIDSFSNNPDLYLSAKSFLKTLQDIREIYETDIQFI